MQELNLKCAFHHFTVDEGKHYIKLDMTITPELKREGLMREVIRHVQAARKAAGLNVDDRIVLGLMTDDAELKSAIEEHTGTIAAETLAEKVDSGEHAYATTVKVGAAQLTITLEKHA